MSRGSLLGVETRVDELLQNDAMPLSLSLVGKASRKAPRHLLAVQTGLIEGVRSSAAPDVERYQRRHSHTPHWTIVQKIGGVIRGRIDDAEDSPITRVGSRIVQVHLQIEA